MLNPSAKTIRLQNRSMTNVSLNLHQLRAPASPGLRRALLMTPILIPSGQYYDVCAQLGCSLDEAQRIVESSPEVKGFVAGGRIIVMPFPPEPEVAPEPVVAPPPPPPPPPTEEAALEELQVLDAVEEETPIPALPLDATAEEPSMDWSEDQLRAYAKKHNIDVSKAKSKSAVLRFIRMGR